MCLFVCLVVCLFMCLCVLFDSVSVGSFDLVFVCVIDCLFAHRFVCSRVCLLV